MKNAKEYKEALEKRINELKSIDRSKYFTEKELGLIDKVYNSVLQVIELEIDCELNGGYYETVWN